MYIHIKIYLDYLEGGFSCLESVRQNNVVEKYLFYMFVNKINYVHK